MKIKSAEFMKSAVNPPDYPVHNLVEVAFAGKSNVGKSSLINSLTNRRALAKTSNTPGRTQLLNFFMINEQVVFVDLPGYGFAKISAKVKKEWGGMIETFLSERHNLRAIILIIDIRRDPTEEDISFIKWLQLHELEVVVVTTKIDKLSKNQLYTRLSAIRKILTHAVVADIIPFSAQTAQGREVIWQKITGIAFTPSHN